MQDFLTQEALISVRKIFELIIRETPETALEVVANVGETG